MLDPRLEAELLAMPEVAALLGEKLAALSAEISSLRTIGAKRVRAATESLEGWERSLAVDCASYATEASLRPLERERKRVERVASKREGDIRDADILRARAYPLADLVPGLRGSGARRTRRCPFHGEKTPSFVAYLESNRWRCFGCNEGGDAIDYLMRSEEIGFVEAVKRLR